MWRLFYELTVNVTFLLEEKTQTSATGKLSGTRRIKK